MVPQYALYGESPQPLEARFIHMETIAERSASVRGAIRPHMHADLSHIFLITAGSGEVMMEAARCSFSGPHLFIIPSGLVHGFIFQTDIHGHVLTLANAFLTDLTRRHDLNDVFDNFRLIAIGKRAANTALKRRFLALRRELDWQAPAWRATAEGQLLSLLVDVWRLGRDEAALALPTSPAHRLVTHLRAEIERVYRDNCALSHFLAVLRVSEAQLRYACDKLGAPPPMRMILERRLTEARRLLIYSDMSINDIALYLGFEDPSYFSRLFARESGAAPRSFRRRQRLHETLRAAS